ncbi:arginine deiminase type-3 [Colletotrichum truncatum]|uniref:Arginine deiminase type-3 n=1 Tax=Colletotrichum truncatum TaxID=5467 RepID=A0ACC3YNG2_COLTU|nr:arginine deiminase type-3 [Colletotrichum truncatum]KAF6792103.1 arginine deiminase type-3 [Colletotrichum truncatum]
MDIRPDVRDDMVVRDEYLGWVQSDNGILEDIDYYGVTFDHLVPTDDADPEVLQINIIETDNDDGQYANTYLPFSVNALDYTGKNVLAVPRCCQKRKGTQDRQRVNESVLERDEQRPVTEP